MNHNSLASLKDVMLVLAAVAVSDEMAGAQVPVVFKVSEGVRPNAVVSLYGEYLTGAPTVRFLKSDGTVGATQTSVQTDRGGISVGSCSLRLPLELTDSLSRTAMGGPRSRST